jgi:hypothetical protein
MEPVQIKVTVSPKTSIFNLSAVGSNPTTTQTYLQATMEEYVKFKRELLETASTTARSTMQEQLDQLAAQLQKSHQDLIDYQSNNSVVLLQSKDGNSAAEFLSSLTRQLAEHRSELHLLKALTLDQNLERQAGIFGGGVHYMRASRSNPGHRVPQCRQGSQLEGSSNLQPDGSPPRNLAGTEVSSIAPRSIWVDLSRVFGCQATTPAP